MTIVEISNSSYNDALDILCEIRMEIKEKLEKEDDFINKYAMRMLWDKLDDIIDEFNTQRRE